MDSIPFLVAYNPAVFNSSLRFTTCTGEKRPCAFSISKLKINFVLYLEYHLHIFFKIRKTDLAFGIRSITYSDQI